MEIDGGWRIDTNKRRQGENEGDFTRISFSLSSIMADLFRAQNRKGMASVFSKMISSCYTFYLFGYFVCTTKLNILYLR